MADQEHQEDPKAPSADEQVTSPAEAAANAENTVEELRVLVDLHEQGKLTEKELADRRAKLLG